MLQLDNNDMRAIVRYAVERIKNDMFGQYLLERFPVRLTSGTEYPQVNAILKQHGSPACTDGKEVYVEPTILRDLLTREYHDLDLSDPNIRTMEEAWRAPIKEDRPRYINSMDDCVDETRDILLHELTHAFNEHTKLRIAADKESETYKKRLDIACELQANDGICGKHYSQDLCQQNKGVTNKRLHPETIGKHTLKGLMDAIELNEQEQQQVAMATAKAMLREAVAKATGEYDKIKRQVQEEQENNSKGREEADAGSGGAMPSSDAMDATSDDKLVNELKKLGLDKVKELILSALSDELRYDATTNSVIFDRVSKRRSHATYSRPSRRIGATGQTTLLRKGVKYTREYEYNKSRKLTVLAVDGSGSMMGQARYVSAVLDDLLRQVDAVAKEYNVEVHYENLQATIHRCRCDRFVPATSDEWAYKMRNYHANGGNDFDCVLRATNNLLENGETYDAITIINLSDGLDELNDKDIEATKIGDYIEQRKVTWVDALIATSKSRLHEASLCARNDIYKIREQVVLAYEP